MDPKSSAAPTLPAPADREFVVTRDFDAPRDLVWRAWTEADRLMRWFGPKGFAMHVAEMDLRPGGAFHYGLRSPNGQEMWGKWVFREIAPPERLAFLASFADEAGNTIRAPFSAEWPLELLSTVTFDERDGRTTLTMRSVPVNATEAERRTFEAGFKSMQAGWGGTLDQLDAHLAEGDPR
ncbi:MAG: SRPBCC domain-containing protein [Armatimonadetes bacterium]|nr:SRPBCC domain-containing protein [Armatimonadota bacterium]